MDFNQFLALVNETRIDLASVVTEVPSKWSFTDKCNLSDEEKAEVVKIIGEVERLHYEKTNHRHYKYKENEIIICHFKNLGFYLKFMIETNNTEPVQKFESCNSITLYTVNNIIKNHNLKKRDK